MSLAPRTVRAIAAYLSPNLGVTAKASAANLGDKTHAINTANKAEGKLCRNTTSNKVFVAQGATDVSTWISVDGATTITPA